MARLGFIGTGAIAAPMVRFLAAKGHSITVTSRSAGTASALAASHGVAVSDAPGVLAAADIVFLCVRPHQVEEALEGLSWRPAQIVVSVMAATPLARLQALCAPARRFVQTIPLGFLEKGGCPLAAFGMSSALADLFEPENPVIAVNSEDALNAHFAICAMVPGLLDLMSSGAGWLGARTGDARGAEVYTKQLVAGFLSAATASLAQERDALATQGTISLQMTEALRDGGAHDGLTEALGAIDRRLNAPTSRAALGQHKEA